MTLLPKLEGGCEGKHGLVDPSKLRPICSQNVIGRRHRNRLPVEKADGLPTGSREGQLVPDRHAGDGNSVATADLQQKLPFGAFHLEVLTAHGDALLFELEGPKLLRNQRRI
eukprot:CAMPEP_0197679902 /NCGR_PEP_ID=MMETSP1338-20131121/92427_1 /TAXON_ID=43686 ORGANISM="Pelagodinium beii, Strain RCC1491" /NCGR_SAMPLE_ID=MMETSP1338 /ASSEMBLY_ACC=CAM_ASM_000754 /LENGTH=111 /DNA_ID=CAMNT_0043261017 /DNA_START=8 /DNA_END=343 /DNA_ORIENTATION=-